MTSTNVFRLRTWLLGVSMIAGPLMILVGHLITVPSDMSPTPYIHDIAADPGLFVFSAVLIATGALLLIVNAVGFLRLAPDRGGIIVTIGGVLVSVAALGLGVGNGMFGVVMGSLVPGHPDIARQVVSIASTAPAAGIPWLLAPALPVGLLVVAIGLLQARTVPLWLPIVLGIGGLLFFVSGAGGLVTMLLLVPMAVGIGGLGVAVLTGARARAGATSTRSVDAAAPAAAR